MRNRRAFTLFEVLVSIAIFMLLAGGIFASVQAAFSASTQIVSAQLDSERLDAFRQFLRRLFVSLPPDARLELQSRHIAGRGDVVEVRIWPVPAFLQFGADSSDGAAISAQPDGRGGFRIMLGYFRAEDTADERDERLQRANWLLLLPGVQQLEWKFARSRNPVLEDKWTQQSGRPGLVELVLTMKDGTVNPSRFWVPPLRRRLSESAGENSERRPPSDEEEAEDDGEPEGGQ